jgi:hypothetical protein
MKKYKDLKKQLMESELQDGGALGGFPTQKTQSAFSDYGVHRLDSSEQVQRLQAFLSSFSDRDYLEPRSAISLLRVKLNLAGLDFDFNNKVNLQLGSVNIFPLKRFGGTFGKTPTTPHDEFETTDGFKELLGHGLNLVVSVTVAESGLYNLVAKIQGAGAIKSLDKPKVI